MKEEKKLIPKLKHFDIKLEVNVPAVINYRVWAEDEEKALSMVTNAPPRSIDYNLKMRRNIKATIYDAYSVTVRLVKRFL